MQGIKRKRRCESDCKEHIFSLHHHKGHSKYEIKLSFCPKYQRQPLKPEQTYPEYNDDQKYYTSAFILGVDKRIMVKNDQQEQMDHQKQIRESLEKNNQLCFPRPNSKHSLCSVCKQHYKNYYFHIASEDHRDRIHMNSYNDHIMGLCNLYKQLWEGAEQRADEEQERLEQQMLLAGSEDAKSYFRSDYEMPRPKGSNDSDIDMDRLADDEKNYEEGEIDEVFKHATVIRSVDKMLRRVESKERNQCETKIIQMKALTKRLPPIPAPLLYEEIKRKSVRKESQKDKDKEIKQIQKEREIQIEKLREKETGKDRQEQNEIYKQKQNQDEQKQQQTEKKGSIDKIKIKKRDGADEDESEESEQKPERSRSLTLRQQKYTATKQQGEFIWKRQEHKPLPNVYPHTIPQKQRIGFPQREQRRDYFDNSNTVPHRYPNYYQNYHSFDSHRNEERDHYNQKAKISHDKGYDYNMMYYGHQPWSYPSPYYSHHPIAHPPPIDPQKPTAGSNLPAQPPPPPNPYLANTNININFPMYMPYSPPGMNYPMHPSRYQMPVNPYMGYQYPPPPPPVTHYNERREHQSSNKPKETHGGHK